MIQKQDLLFASKVVSKTHLILEGGQLDLNSGTGPYFYLPKLESHLEARLWNDIFIATKVGWDMGPYNHWYHPEHMRVNMERSLKNLKTDCVDLMYLHHCNFGKQEQYFDDAVETIRRFQAEGKTRFIGLSDWSSDKVMNFIERVDPDVIQPYRNVMDDTYASTGLKDYVEANNLGICFF